MITVPTTCFFWTWVLGQDWEHASKKTVLGFPQADRVCTSVKRPVAQDKALHMHSLLRIKYDSACRQQKSRAAP